MKRLTSRPVVTSRGQAATNLLLMADQAVSSLANMVTAVVMATKLPAADFGLFALLSTTLALFVGLTRAYFGVEIASRNPSRGHELADLFRASVSALVVAAVPVAVGTCAIGVAGAKGVLVGGGLAIAIAVAVGAPVVLLQDVARYYARSVGRVYLALLSDVAWLCGVISLWLWAGNVSASTVMALWVLVLVVALLVVLLPLWPGIAIADGVRLLAPKRGIRESAALTVLASTGTTLIVGLIVSRAYDASALGAIRGASTLFGPINTLVVFLDFGILSELARRPRTRDSLVLIRLVAALLVLTGAWGAILLSLPASMGQALLGETWPGTRAILGVTFVEYPFIVILASVALIFKARRRAKPLIRARLLASCVTLTLVIAVSASAGPFVLVPWALVVGSLAGSVFSVMVHLRTKDDHQSSGG